jgi:hypothetical protein
MGAVHVVDALRGSRAWLLGGLALSTALAGCSSAPRAAEDAGVSCEVLSTAPPCVDPPASFANDIFPMLDRDCNGTCHIAGGIAWPLTSYQDVSDWALLIQIQVQQCEMPPTDAGTLPSGDRAALLNWIACGSPNN